MATIIIWTIQLILLPALSPLCVGIIRKMKAKFQNRQGAGVFQPYNDLWKLFNKDEVISSDASWIFRFAPFIVFAATLAVTAGIPTFASFLSNELTSDILVVIYILAISTFFLALAGMDTGSAFGGFASSREMTVAALAEGGVLFSLLTVALISGTTNLFSISGADFISQFPPSLPVILAFMGFFIAMLAETSRFPFDNPATHLELTMIHEAMILEYSGKKLALMEWAAANKLMIFMALAANLFFPVGIAKDFSIGALALGFLALAIKVGILCLAIAIIESAIAKLRFFRLPDLLLISFILNAVAIILIF